MFSMVEESMFYQGLLQMLMLLESAQLDFQISLYGKRVKCYSFILFSFVFYSLSIIPVLLHPKTKENNKTGPQH